MACHVAVGFAGPVMLLSGLARLLRCRGLSQDGTGLFGMGHMEARHHPEAPDSFHTLPPPQLGPFLVASPHRRCVHTMKDLPTCDFIETRLALFDKLKASYCQALKEKERKPIKCTLPDGQVVQGVAFETTPKQLLLQHLKSEENIIVARVDGTLWDLTRPLEADSPLEYLSLDDPDGQYVFSHSSAHILGETMECLFGAKLCSGPPVDQGFYYDVFMGNRNITGSDLSEIEVMCRRIVAMKQPFERVEVRREDLEELFKDNEFKLRILRNKVQEPFTTVYRCGKLVDLCRGPHLEHTGISACFSITKNSSAYWKGDPDAESLQRVYGVSFPTEKQMQDWHNFLADAAKRDHRKLGKDHELYFFNDLSPGSCFFLPKGAHIYNKLTEFMRVEYRKRGFKEVISPNMFNVKLWKTSGHYENYADNMFMFNIENEQFALKPMNCPGHCLMYSMRPRSWKELPLRFADFGVLHRNETSGSLSGLTRVRRFCQDDAHIFCASDQVGSEIQSCLEFLFFVHRVLGFSVSIKLSTRPEKYLGSIEIWDHAETVLTSVLNESGHKWELNPGDGAFYGPKIDIQVKDALNRWHQISTIQLDFNLPNRFALSFINKSDQMETPVMIHRAILGSLERVIGVLTETYGGKWPFWLSPCQVRVIPVKPKFDAYATSWVQRLSAAGYAVDMDSDTTCKLDKKIRTAVLLYFNFIFVVGAKEEDHQTVCVRNRVNQLVGERTFEQVLAHFKDLEEQYIADDEAPFKE